MLFVFRQFEKCEKKSNRKLLKAIVTVARAIIAQIEK